MTRRLMNSFCALLIGLALVSALPRDAGALALNEEGTMNLTVRAYANVRIGTMAKQSVRPGNQPPSCAGSPPDALQTCSFGGTFPYSGAGNVIQNRYFLDARINHDLLDWWSDVLPKNVTTFKYNLTYRGEYEGIYDFGPSAYKNSLESRQELEEALRQSPTFQQAQLDSIDFSLGRQRRRLRNVASYRNRLFQAFVDWEQGPVFVRFGRQNLVWGETDVFRLLDNINPIDNGFGGFFIDLDERRVPLNMLRGSLSLGSLGPFEQAFLEGYAAMDNTVAFVPGAPRGSPWAPPLGPPTGQTLTILEAPPTGLPGLRGGGRFVFNFEDFTFTTASYVTMLDTQAVRFRSARPTDPGFVAGVSVIGAEQYAPRVWVNGASMTTAFSDLQSVLRAEFAYFRDEALFRGPTETAFPGKGTTPQYITEFLGPVAGGTFDTVQRKNTMGWSVGWDMNQFVRFINPNQSLFFSTQFFWRHIFDYDPLTALPVPEPNNQLRVVPVPQDQFLQTLLINTTYNVAAPFTDITMQAIPGFQMFYDWQGMLLFQPNVRFIRDPWRFIVDYTTINSGVFRSQIGLVRDRSNVRMQIEYVL
ncbi:MAG: DUF1302 domain-containing protein [Deltaproteobacteria bacterium]|nr:DUF1302 domain-containing protein [Deltaproteobacteria bacterium]